jgi:hypothetical protein
MKIFLMITGMIARSRTSNDAAVANHRTSIRNTREALKTSRMIALR